MSTTAAITDPTTWLPRGQYLTFLVDGADAKLAAVGHQPAGVAVDTSVDGQNWQHADPQDWVTALMHVAASPVAAAQNHGRILGACHCGTHLTADERRHGTCTNCRTPERRRELTDAAPLKRAVIRDSAIDELIHRWRKHGSDVKTRTLRNIGPVIVEKLDATLRHVKEGKLGQPMPIPAHAIREREDPRFDGQITHVAARLDQATYAEFAWALHWVNVPSMQHMIANLDADTAEFKTARCGSIVEARQMLAAFASNGRRILHGSLSCDPGLCLSVTYTWR